MSKNNCEILNVNECEMMKNNYIHPEFNDIQERFVVARCVGQHF